MKEKIGGLGSERVGVVVLCSNDGFDRFLAYFLRDLIDAFGEKS